MERLLAEQGGPSAAALDLAALPSQLTALSDEDWSQVQTMIDDERRSRVDKR